MLFRALRLLLFLSTMTVPARAAEIEVLNNHPEGCNAMLTGQIAAGDVQTLQTSMIGTGENARYFHDVVTLCLDSPGGSFLEGLAIARQLREAGIATHVPAGAHCLSACALAFMGGSRLGFEDGVTHRFNRSLHTSAQLGFHAPQLDIPPGQFNESAVKRAFGLALKSSALIFARLEELGLTQDFALAFFDVPEGSFLMVDTPDRADAAQVTVTGTGPCPAGYLLIGRSNSARGPFRALIAGSTTILTSTPRSSEPTSSNCRHRARTASEPPIFRQPLRKG